MERLEGRTRPGPPPPGKHDREKSAPYGTCSATSTSMERSSRRQQIPTLPKGGQRATFGACSRLRHSPASRHFYRRAHCPLYPLYRAGTLCLRKFRHVDRIPNDLCALPSRSPEPLAGPRHGSPTMDRACFLRNSDRNAGRRFRPCHSRGETKLPAQRVCLPGSIRYSFRGLPSGTTHGDHGGVLLVVRIQPPRQDDFKHHTAAFPHTGTRLETERLIDLLQGLRIVPQLRVHGF